MLCFQGHHARARAGQGDQRPCRVRKGQVLGSDAQLSGSSRTEENVP